MIKKVTLAVSFFSVVLSARLVAQNVYFTGVGRALVTNDRLSDQTKLASKMKASGGYTLFDLGIYAKPNEVLRGGVILRVRNAFGGFFGDGASLQFRQMQLEGLIAKQVKYDIGDIYLTHTPYTLWNEDLMGSKYESTAFRTRRDIVNYENFFVGNAWRMQGFNTRAKVTFKKGAESLGIRVYGGRTRQTDFTSIPDRYFYGGRLDLTQSKYFRIAGNLAGLSDIPGTVKSTSINYSNLVYTTDFDLTFDNSDKFKFVLRGEAGASHLEMQRSVDSTTKTLNDYFYDGGAKATYKPLKLTLGVSYRNVGYNFNSPMAQTRRIASPSDVTLSSFPKLNNGITPRSISLYDFYSQESRLYNQAISPTLMNYYNYIQYTIVEPYGKATPNRKGFTFSADLEESEKKVFSASFEANLLSEVVSEGDSLTLQKRKFNLMRGGFVFNLSNLIGFEKLIAISSGIRTESSKRSGTNAVSLSNMLLDVGLDIEVMKDLHLLGGAKYFTVKGNEYSSERNAMNQIIGFGTGNTFNQTQRIIAPGLRYDYGTSGYFSMQYHIIKVDNKDDTKTNYTMNQWFFVFGLKF